MQGFPEDWPKQESEASAFLMLGNAEPPAMAAAFAERAHKFLCKVHGKGREKPGALPEPLTVAEIEARRSFANFPTAAQESFDQALRDTVALHNLGSDVQWQILEAGAADAEAPHSDLGGECPYSAGWESRTCGAARKKVSRQEQEGQSRKEKRAARQQHRPQKEKVTEGTVASQLPQGGKLAGGGRQAWVADMKQAKKGRTRRSEIAMQLDDPRLLSLKAECLANSLAVNTVKAYSYRFRHFVEFCDRAETSHLLTGDDPQADERTLTAFALYEFGIHKNKHATIQGKLSAIRWHVMEAGFANPLDGKPTLRRVMAGIRRLRGRTDPKEPLPVEVIRYLLFTLLEHGDLFQKALALACVVAFFWLLRVSEFAAQDSHHMEKWIIRRQDVTFRKKGKPCTWFQSPDEVELHLRGSKTDQVMQGVHRSQHLTGTQFCPLLAMVTWFKFTHGANIPSSAPLFAVPQGKTGGNWKVIERQHVSEVLKQAATDCGIPSHLIGTHSLRISGSTALLLAGVHYTVVQLIGRWKTACFLRYQRYQSELMQNVARAMADSNYQVRLRPELKRDDGLLG